jgi:YfiH family protein
MKVNLYQTPPQILVGITLADPAEPEAGNMALHVCENTGNIIKNRRKLAVFLNCGPDSFVCSQQTHSANFYKVTSADRRRGSITTDDAIPETDALYTFEADIMLCCFTADCVPLILYDEKSGLIGTIHSGWEGTVKEITPKVLKHLIDEEHCSAADIKIILGPALSSMNFEVDRDVSERFEALGYATEFITYDEHSAKYHIDNRLTVKRQCELAGILSENILTDEIDTFTNPDCFSYRRDKSCGRHLSFIMKRG